MVVAVAVAQEGEEVEVTLVAMLVVPPEITGVDLHLAVGIKEILHPLAGRIGRQIQTLGKVLPGPIKIKTIPNLEVFWTIFWSFCRVKEFTVVHISCQVNRSFFLFQDGVHRLLLQQSLRTLDGEETHPLRVHQRLPRCLPLTPEILATPATPVILITRDGITEITIGKETTNRTHKTPSLIGEVGLVTGILSLLLKHVRTDLAVGLDQVRIFMV